MEVPLHEHRRGFVNVDGVFANNISLHSTIKMKRRQRKGYAIITLDIRKAFDTLSHASIERALKRKGVDVNTIQYIMANFTDATTVIRSAGEENGTLQLKRGTKQGDPMSPILFNIMMDELIEELEGLPGISVEDQKIRPSRYQNQ